MRFSCLVALTLLILAAPALAPPARTPSVACTLEVSHPIQIEVRLVEEMVPGRWLQAEVQVQSDLDLSGVEVQLQADAAVELTGSRKISWAALAAATPRALGFEVRVPETRTPLQVRVQVRGNAEGAWLERGAVLHLLPQGRHQTPRVSEAKGQSVLEYRGAARREP